MGAALNNLGLVTAIISFVILILLAYASIYLIKLGLGGGSKKSARRTTSTASKSSKRLPRKLLLRQCNLVKFQSRNQYQ